MPLDAPPDYDSLKVPHDAPLERSYSAASSISSSEEGDALDIEGGPILDPDKVDLSREIRWTDRPPSRAAGTFAPLQVPVVIPQTIPALTALFCRAWAPVLATHDVTPFEFLQFLDHLNVCKTASPPLQVVHLAATVVGFVPSGIAQLVSGATDLAATAGMVAVAKTRIANFLKLSNERYFAPRGLRVRMVKDEMLPTVLGQQAGASVLSPLTPSTGQPLPNLRERRLSAMRGYIADLQFDGLPESATEKTLLDRISASASRKKLLKDERKAQKRAQKGLRKQDKNERKAEKALAKLDLKAEEAHRKAERKLQDKPEKAEKVEKRREKRLAKIERDVAKEQSKQGGAVSSEKEDKRFGKEEKKARKFVYVVIDNLPSASNTVNKF